MLDKAELRRMSPAERQELASLLAELDVPAAAAILAGAGMLAGARAQASQAAGAGPDAPDWAQVGNWGRSCAGQSLRSTPLAGAGLNEALPHSHAKRRAEQADQARQSA